MTSTGSLLVAAFCLSIAASSASAQGRSASAPGQTKARESKTAAAQSGIPASSSGSAPTNAPSNSSNGVIYYGSWLDDASIVPAGGAWIGLSTGYWKAEALRQIDAPVISGVVGLTNRLQIGGSVPIYHFRDDTGLSESGVGNMTIYGKALIVDPAVNASRIGVAVAPLLEISSSAVNRIGWALPLNLEVRRDHVRMYGSAGYFSRGSVFGSVAAEIPSTERTSFTGTFGQSYADAGSHQTAVGISFAIFASPTTSFYVGLGHTSQPVTVGPGGTSFAAGAAFLLSAPRIP